MTPAAFDGLVGIVGHLSLFHPILLDAPEVVDDDFGQLFLERVFGFEGGHESIPVDEVVVEALLGVVWDSAVQSMNQAVPAGAFFALIAGGSGRVLRILGISFFEIRHCLLLIEGNAENCRMPGFTVAAGWWIFGGFFG